MDKRRRRRPKRKSPTKKKSPSTKRKSPWTKKKSPSTKRNRPRTKRRSLRTRTRTRKRRRSLAALAVGRRPRRIDALPGCSAGAWALGTKSRGRRTWARVDAACVDASLATGHEAVFLSRAWLRPCPDGFHTRSRRLRLVHRERHR